MALKRDIILKNLSGKKKVVMEFILDNIDEHNLLHFTIPQISKKVGIELNKVKTIVNRLISYNLLFLCKKGEYLVSPYFYDNSSTNLEKKQCLVLYLEITDKSRIIEELYNKVPDEPLYDTLLSNFEENGMVASDPKIYKKLDYSDQILLAIFSTKTNGLNLAQFVNEINEQFVEEGKSETLPMRLKGKHFSLIITDKPALPSIIKMLKDKGLEDLKEEYYVITLPCASNEVKLKYLGML